MGRARFEKRAIIATAPGHAARLGVYQPSRRPINRTGEWVETSWGRAKVTGRLGQRHADIVDGCTATALQRYQEPDGRIRLLVDPAKLRRVIGTKQYSHQRLWALLKNDIMRATVEWEAGRDGVRGIGHIIDEVVESSVTAPDPLRPGRTRQLWRITIGASWAMSMEHDIECRYDVKAVAALKYGISQAVARLCLSHDRRKWPVTGLNIDTVLEWLKLPAGQKRWDAKRRLPADKDGLKRLGLLIDEEKILALRPDVSPANREAGLAPRPNKLDQRPDELDLRPEYWHNGPMP